jgi:Xaa-Pro aminopeptidase
MLTAEGCAERRKRIWDRLPEPCDVLVLGDPASLIYFGNYVPSTFVFRPIDSVAVLVLEPGKATLVADSNLKAYLAHAHVDEVVAPVWYDGKHSAPHRRQHLVRTALDVLAKVAGKQIGIELGSVPAGIAEGLSSARAGLRLIELDTVVRGMRRVKDADELALIRRAIRAGEAGHAAALAGIKPGMSELDAYLLVAGAANEAAGEQVIVYGDFVSGPRCETERGGSPSTRTIEPCDLFLLDYSVVVHGYRGDFTNTFVVGGAPTAAQRDLFDACMSAMGAGEMALKAGVPARSIDDAVRASIAARGLEHAFPSHSGHGIGLSHPEPPYFVRQSTDEVLAGDVVAIEPGLFVPGVGGMRFERNYVVTAIGFENLTHHRLTLEP